MLSAICITLLVCCVSFGSCQKYPHDPLDYTDTSGPGPGPRYPFSNGPVPPERTRQFIMSCPRGCHCDETICGLTIDCSDRGLSDVPRDLSPLTECLDLSMNNISSISSESFAGLKQLQKLSLFGNIISELPEGIFTSGFKKMHTLLLQDNRLTSVPVNTISKMGNLKNLNLGANFIEEISANAFARLENLEHVWLDDNFLSEIPFRALSKAPNIKALNLDMNRITTVRNGDLDALVKLRVLLLKHNGISMIENNAFESSRNIRILELSYNNLTSLPIAIKVVQNLEQLIIPYNNIEELPDLAFAGNPELRQLSLAGNPIRSVGPASFSGLSHLQTLYLRNVEDQKEIPDFSGCSSLKELSIDGGKIKSVPQSFCSNLPSIRKLSLKGNNLRSLMGLSKCSNLTSLDVSGNQLTELIFNETKHLTKMLDLKLGNNKIKQIDEDAFSEMKMVRKINLAYNSFTYLPMNGLGNLRELNISGVRTMFYLPPVDLFHSLRSLVAYYPYHCCQVARMKQKLAETSLTSNYMQPGIQDSSFSPQNHPFAPLSSPVQCSPDPGPMTPCDDLLPSTPLRIFSWIAMIVAFILNALILLSCGLRYCVRRRSRGPTTIPSDEQMLRRADSDSPYTEARAMVYDDSEVYGSHYCLNLTRGSRSMYRDSDSFDLALCHLALADFIVSAYTAVLLSYDHATRGEFAVQGAWWQQSSLCHSAGFLLTFGTQLAFTTIAVMSVERYLATMYPLQTERHLRKNLLVLALISAWALSLMTGIVTLFGGAGDEAIDGIQGMMPAKSGASCLPWTTDFVYIGTFVGLHVLLCLVTTMFCVMMFCAKRKQSWLSARKNTRRQVTLSVVFNIICILPLAAVGLYVSGMMTFSDMISGQDDEYASPDGSHTVLDMGRLLAFVMFLIPFRPMLNPILYIAFNKGLRGDLIYVTRKIFMNDSNPRHIQFPPQQNSILETMFDSVTDVPREAGHNFSHFTQPVFDNTLLQQAVAYDNRGIASSSSVSYHAPPSVALPQSSSHSVSGQRSAERKRRRRHTRSRRTERRTTDTDPTTESEVITFHRGGEAVSYNPDARERRRKKLSVRNGGVNAKDEFQRLVFPQRPIASSSQASDSTIYPIMPANRSVAQQSSYHNNNTVALSAPARTDARGLLTENCELNDHESNPTHYDLSALNSFCVSDVNDTRSRAMTESPTEFQSRNSGETSATSFEVDMEVAEINSAAFPPCVPDENHFFGERDTVKRLRENTTRNKTIQRARSREDESYLLQAMRNASHDDSMGDVNGKHPVKLTMRKERAASHSSGSSDNPLLGRVGKISVNSCEYCDSAASKDSGIHSEIDSASGASYSDTSIGRRLRLSTNNVHLKNGVISTLCEQDIDRFKLPQQSEFDIILTGTNKDLVNENSIGNPETTI
ncbi:leucine-rich repeat-containing G-protein coupled receptor 5A-like [Styela clava]